MKPGLVIAHELIGLDVKIVESTNRYMEGIEGKVVDETQNTLVIEGEKGLKRVPKKGNVFIFKFAGHNVRVRGDLIAFRPEERIKRGLQIIRRGRR